METHFTHYFFQASPLNSVKSLTHEPTRAQCTQTAQTHRTWKRLSHDHAPNPKMAEVSIAVSKHELDLTDGGDDGNKKQKLDNDTRILGKIFAEQLGSAVVVA